MEENEKCIYRSDQGGYHSEVQTDKDDYPKLNALGIELLQQLRECVSEHFYIESAWVNINRSGNWNLLHNHAPGHLSSVFYIDAEIDSENVNGSRDGNLIFFDPLGLSAYGRMDSHCYIVPENKKFLIFPAYLSHMVAPHYSDKPRISVAYNYVEHIEN